MQCRQFDYTSLEFREVKVENVDMEFINVKLTLKVMWPDIKSMHRISCFSIY